MAEELHCERLMDGQLGHKNSGNHSKTSRELTAGPAVRGILSRTLHYCELCKHQTPHAIGLLGKSEAITCLVCAERTSRFELDRD